MNKFIQVVKMYLTNRESVSVQELKLNALEAEHQLDVARVVASTAKSAYISRLNPKSSENFPDDDADSARYNVENYNRMMKGVSL